MGQLKATTKTTSSCSQSVTSLPHVKETMIKSKSWATPSQTGPSRADSAILQYESPIHTPFLLFDVTWHKIQLYILLMNELLNCISKIEGHFSWCNQNQLRNMTVLFPDTRGRVPTDPNIRLFSMNSVNASNKTVLGSSYGFYFVSFYYAIKN